MVLIFGAVLDLWAGVLAGTITGAGIVAFWLVLPVLLRVRGGTPEARSAEDRSPRLPTG